jgi:hypothetical protein
MAPQFFRRVENLGEPSTEQLRTLLQIRASNEDELKFRSEQFGLFAIHIPTQEELATLRYVHEVDIIAVHGLGGDPYFTWQHSNGFNWLQHIHEELPGARVFSYGYDSGIAFSMPSLDLQDYARHLLEVLKLMRVSKQVLCSSYVSTECS